MGQGGFVSWKKYAKKPCDTATLTRGTNYKSDNKHLIYYTYIISSVPLNTMYTFIQYTVVTVEFYVKLTVYGGKFCNKICF